MNEFYLFYWGLICHIGPVDNPDIKTHAALAYGEDHHRLLIFEARTVELTSNLTFSDTPGFALMNEDFASVSSLRTLLNGEHDLKNEVESADPVPAIALHVMYPSDANVRLGVANLYRNPGRHTRNNTSAPPRVIPRITYAKITTTASQLPLRFTGAGTQDVLTRDNPCVLIANVETPRDDSNDFGEYRSLLVGEPDPGTMTDEEHGHGFQVPFPGPRRWVLRHVDGAPSDYGVKAALSTECGNTQWP